MEIHALRLSITEDDLNELIRRHMPADQPVEELRVRFTPEGIAVTGQYPFFINVHFETVWEVAIVGGLVAVRLARFKAMGVPGNIFKSAIMKGIEDAARKETWIRITDDVVVLDLEAGSAQHGVPAKLRIRAITVTPGQVMLESGE